MGGEEIPGRQLVNIILAGQPGKIPQLFPPGSFPLFIIKKIADFPSVFGHFLWAHFFADKQTHLLPRSEECRQWVEVPNCGI